MDRFPKGIDAIPKGMDLFPKGMDSIPKKIDRFPKGMDLFPKVFPDDSFSNNRREIMLENSYLFESVLKNVIFKKEILEDKVFSKKAHAVQEVCRFLNCSAGRVSQIVADGELSFLEEKGGCKVKFLSPRILQNLISKTEKKKKLENFFLSTSFFFNYFIGKNDCSTFHIPKSSRKILFSTEEKDRFSQKELLLYFMLCTVWINLTESLCLDRVELSCEEFFRFFLIHPESCMVPGKGYEEFRTAIKKFKKEFGEEYGIFILDGKKKEKKMNSLLSAEELNTENIEGFRLNSVPALLQLEEILDSDSHIPFSLIFSHHRDFSHVVIRFSIIRRIFLTKRAKGKMNTSITKRWVKENIPDAIAYPYIVTQAMEDCKKIKLISDFELKEEKKTDLFLEWKF